MIYVFTHFSGQINEQTAVTITLNMHIYAIWTPFNFWIASDKGKGQNWANQNMSMHPHPEIIYLWRRYP